MPDNPYFSIVVPTRNREDTLLHCLRTLIDQDFDSYEIIVSDNSDNLLSKDVVDQLNCSKIKYFKQQTVLPMTDNYEFAVAQTSGEYVICIGDDDGLVINGLSYIYQFIQQYQARMIKCCTAVYCWKGSLINPDSILNYPMSRAVQRMDSKSVLRKVFSMELDYFHLPMMYYGCVHRSLIDEIKSIQGSVFADASSLDMYSGMCIAHLTDSFYVSDYPFTIMGNSAKSNGTNHHQKAHSKNAISREFVSLGKVDEKYQALGVPKIHQDTKSITWLSLKQFMKNMHVADDTYPLNDVKFYLKMQHPNPIVHQLHSGDELRQAFIDAGYSEAWIHEAEKRFTTFPAYYPSVYAMVHFFSNHVSIDPNLFGINNVYDCAQLCLQLKTSGTQDTPFSISKEAISDYTKRKWKTLFRYFWKTYIRKGK